MTEARTAGLRTIAEIRQGLEGIGTWAALESSFDALPKTVHRAIEDEFNWGRIACVEPVSEDALAKFQTTPEGKALASEWGVEAPYRVAQVRERMWRVILQL